MTKLIKRLKIENNSVKVPVIALFDTRTCWSLIKSAVTEKLCPGRTQTWADGSCVGRVQIGGRVLDGKFRILPKLPRHVDMVIGIDLMVKWQFNIDWKEKNIVFET